MREKIRCDVSAVFPTELYSSCGGGGGGGWLYCRHVHSKKKDQIILIVWYLNVLIRLLTLRHLIGVEFRTKVEFKVCGNAATHIV